MKTYINDFGGICACGKNSKEILNAISSKNSKNFIQIKSVKNKQFAVAEIKEKEYFTAFKNLPKTLHSRTNYILYKALLQIKDYILKVIEKYGKNRVCVIIGTTTSAVEENLNDINNIDLEIFTKRNSLSNPSEFVREFLGLKSLTFGISSACTSGGKSLVSAKNLLEKNLCDAVICGGVDSLNSLTLFGFDSLEILSPTQSLSFSKNRNGVNLGEGAAVFVLSKEKESGSIEFKGFGSNNDAFHITKPNESCHTQRLMLNSALKMAQLKTSDIDYINLHGTGTIANDKMEAELVFENFNNKSCSSTKSAMGHTLGAAGALEAMICLELLKQTQEFGSVNLPLHRFDGVFDSTLAKIALIDTPKKACVKNALSLSFAFGGDNLALIFGV